MRVGRRFILAIALALGSVGCRAAGTGSLSLHPRPLLQPGALDVETFIAEHNRNAERIQSLEAKPSIKVASRLNKVPVDGRMALERPRNFRLELSSLGTSKADLGSNDDEFWFWVSNRDDPSIYWCKYADLESSRAGRDLPAGLDHRGDGPEADLPGGGPADPGATRTGPGNDRPRLPGNSESQGELHARPDRFESGEADQAAPDSFGGRTQDLDRTG